MNALTTSLEEVGKPLEAENIIRDLKPQYDRPKSLPILKEEQVFVGKSTRKACICVNCKKHGHSIETCWAKGDGKEGQGLRQKKRKELKKKKKGKTKANTAKETSGEGDEHSVAFIIFDCVALIKDRSEVIVILDTSASSHMTPHQRMLRYYHSFTQPRKIQATNQGIFEALGLRMLMLSVRANGKKVEIILKEMLYAPSIAFTLSQSAGMMMLATRLDLHIKSA